MPDRIRENRTLALFTTAQTLLLPARTNTVLHNRVELGPVTKESLYLGRSLISVHLPGNDYSGHQYLAFP
jgi:hypothetical protein